jgi:hypothetical protein
MDEGVGESLDGDVDESEDGRSEARVEQRCLLAKTEKRKAKRPRLFA